MTMEESWNPTIACLFPGQGAQHCGMGRSFFDGYHIYRETVEEACDSLGKDLRKLLFDTSDEELLLTENSQLVLFVNSVGIMRVLQQLFPVSLPGTFAGHSLGEFTALHCSRYLPHFGEALQLVHDRAYAMKNCCERYPGAMIAVIGITEKGLHSLLEEPSLRGQVWVANHNSPMQKILAGSKTAMEQASELALQAGAKRVVPLKVQGAFHTPLMREASDFFADQLRRVSLVPSQASFVSNARGTYLSSVETIREALSLQMHSPVLWQHGVESMGEKGVELFIEVGGNILTALNRRILPLKSSYALNTTNDLFEIEKCLLTQASA